jgi:probable inorganic polyphosphate/ATP-NAD kinase
MNYSNLKFALFGNIYQTKKNQYVARIFKKLEELGVQIWVESDFADFIDHNLDVVLNNVEIFSKEKLPQVDVAISIGGDGTFLGTAALVGSSGIPILGINTGRLGFLADISPENINTSLEALCKGDYVIENRKALEVMKNGVRSDFYPFALNEVAVLKHDNSSLIEINTYVNDNFLTNYLADGLIVSTPTGSTGYSLSVGGPVLVPQSGTFCIAPIAPHSLAVRPVVVRDDVEIKMEVRSRTNNFLLACDGQSESLNHATTITAKCAPYAVKVIKIAHKHFFETLRDKMMWGADHRA